MMFFFFLLIAVTVPSPTTGEESALDAAEQAAPPGVVLVDAGAARRDEEAVGSISQDTQIQWSLFSLFHPALQTIFSIRFPVVFRSESRGVSHVVLVIWCCLPRIFPQFHEMCFMFLLCRMFTTDALASRRELLQNCSSATSSGPTNPFSGCARSPTIRTTPKDLAVAQHLKDRRS